MFVLTMVMMWRQLCLRDEGDGPRVGKLFVWRNTVLEYVLRAKLTTFITLALDRVITHWK